ncbi:MAG: acyl-ACP--UDP-N-acetylglucosamine O-acyltransferase [Gammaproteobacteria bacterium]
MANHIHPTAVIDPAAGLGSGIRVGPYAVIEADAVIGDGCSIGAHSVIKRHTRMGRDNRVHEHVTLGGDPQDLAFQPCVSHLEIGADNVFRESVTVHRGSRPNGVTRIGDGNYLMAYSHVAHDCTLGARIILANCAALGGYVTVGDRAFLSAHVAVHQFCRIGRIAMVSGLAGVNMDCLPFLMVTGAPARAVGLNLVGLKRAGIASEEVAALKRAYRLLFLSETPVREALADLAAWPSPLVREWVEFAAGAKRGFTRRRP